MQPTTAGSCAAYRPSLPSTSDPVFSSADGVEEAFRSADDVAVRSRMLGWFEQRRSVTFTQLTQKIPQLGGWIL